MSKQELRDKIAAAVAEALIPYPIVMGGGSVSDALNAVMARLDDLRGRYAR